jgi:general secretion pathway protein G
MVHRQRSSLRASIRGFTLIELVVVIAVVAILAGFLVPMVLGQTARARQARARSDVNEYTRAFARLRLDTGSSSSACYTNMENLTQEAAVADCLGAITSKCNTLGHIPGDVCWGGPYLSAVALDPWERPYTATFDTNARTVTVTSKGPDGLSGTADDISVAE